MIKFVLAALWASIVTLGAVLYSYQYARDDGDTVAAPPFFGGLDYVRTGVISVPVVRVGAVDGYFLARLVYTVEPDKVKRLSVPADMLLVDQVRPYLYSSPLMAFSDRSVFDFGAFRANLRARNNERVGEQVVLDVIVEPIDYQSKAEIRDHARRRAASSAQEG